MSGPEGKYIAKVHRQLDKLLSPTGFHFSNTNPYVGGIPDQYYEDTKSCLWIEYKAVKTLPKSIDLTKPKMLTANQLKWLRRSQLNHGNVAVILGTESGEGVWFSNLSWEMMHPINTVVLQTPKEIASKIAKHICG